MTKKDFLDIFNDIGDEFIDEFANAAQNKKDSGDFPLEDFGSPQRPQIIRLERPPKKRISRAPFIAAFTAAAVLVCAVTVGALFKRKDPQTVSPNDSVILSEPLSKPDPIIIEPNSSEPAVTASEPTSYEATSREPISSEPAVTEPKIKRVEQDGYDFALEIDENDKSRGQSGPFMKIDSEEELAICFSCSRECEGERFTIAFFSYDGRTRTVGKRIAAQTFTAESDTQWFSVPYKNEFEEGDECIMFISPVSSNNTSLAAIKGRILP